MTTAVILNVVLAVLVVAAVLSLLGGAIVKDKAIAVPRFGGVPSRYARSRGTRRLGRKAGSRSGLPASMSASR